jgi:hypothetical protein
VQPDAALRQRAERKTGSVTLRPGTNRNDTRRRNVIVESRGESGRIVPSSVRVTAESRGALPGTTANVADRVPASGAAASKAHIADMPLAASHETHRTS